VSLAELLISLASQLPTRTGSDEAGLGLEVTGMELEVPVEARIVSGGQVLASLPRGRLATGFDMPHGRLSAHFDVRRD